jgi:hypothetical protein
MANDTGAGLGRPPRGTAFGGPAHVRSCGGPVPVGPV